MRNKFDLRKPVYHKSYGRMIIERYIEANLDEPDTENQYDCEYLMIILIEKEVHSSRNLH